MNAITITSFDGQQELLSSSISNFALREGNMTAMLADNSYNGQAGALKHDTLYNVQISSGDESVISGLMLFESYNYVSGVDSAGAAVVYDNTLLFRRING